MAKKGWWEKLLEEKDKQVTDTMDESERMKYEEEKESRRPKPEPEDDEGFLMKTLRAFTSRSKKR